MILLVKIFAISFVWPSVHSINQRDKVFFLEKSSDGDNNTLLVVTLIESEDEITAGCELFTDKDLINEVLASSNDSPIRTLTGEEMQNLFQDCSEFALGRKRRQADEDESENETIPPHDISNEPSELARRRQSRRQNTRAGRSRANSRRQEARKSTTTMISNAIESTTSLPLIENTTDQWMSETMTNKWTTETAKNKWTTETTKNKLTTETTTEPTTTEITTNPPTTVGYDGLPIVFPGTKWCGAGDIAKSYDDLGMHQDTDRCCRAHDLCNDTIAPRQTRYNLTNTSPFTKLSCKCDQDFYDCLSRVNSFTSNTIGNMYFNLLKRDCYGIEYPLTNKCKNYLTLLKITCLEYERNTTAPKVYQWIPAVKYKNMPVPG